MVLKKYTLKYKEILHLNLKFDGKKIIKIKDFKICFFYK